MVERESTFSPHDSLPATHHAESRHSDTRDKRFRTSRPPPCAPLGAECQCCLIETVAGRMSDSGASFSAPGLRSRPEPHMRRNTLTIWVVVCLAGSTALLSQGRKSSMSVNPLVKPWTGPYGGVPPWDQMKPALFPEALETALSQQREEIEAIVANREAPTFENTIVAMDRTGRTLDRVERMFSVARENVTTPEYQALERERQPKLSAASDAIVFNPGLFKRIETVYRSLKSTVAADLEPDQVRLATRVFEHFVRRGGERLSAAEK